eukprot:13662519-Alexandrium_andersonii.AAC.1
MSASLVGSEMCIRDRMTTKSPAARQCDALGPMTSRDIAKHVLPMACLLYTSDAADDMQV